VDGARPMDAPTRPPGVGKPLRGFPHRPPRFTFEVPSPESRPRRACARPRSQTILRPPTSWPLLQRSSVAAFERSVTLELRLPSLGFFLCRHRTCPAVRRRKVIRVSAVISTAMLESEPPRVFAAGSLLRAPCISFIALSPTWFVDRHDCVLYAATSSLVLPPRAIQSRRSFMWMRMPRSPTGWTFSWLAR
jgi:hypothetical protein